MADSTFSDAYHIMIGIIFFYRNYTYSIFFFTPLRINIKNNFH